MLKKIILSKKPLLLNYYKKYKMVLELMQKVSNQNTKSNVFIIISILVLIN